MQLKVHNPLCGAVWNDHERYLSAHGNINFNRIGLKVNSKIRLLAPRDNVLFVPRENVRFIDNQKALRYDKKKKGGLNEKGCYHNEQEGNKQDFDNS